MSDETMRTPLVATPRLVMSDEAMRTPLVETPRLVGSDEAMRTPLVETPRLVGSDEVMRTPLVETPRLGGSDEAMRTPLLEIPGVVDETPRKASKKPSYKTIAMVIVQHMKWFLGRLAYVGVVSKTKGFQPCNQHGCLYFVAFSREHQPSSVGLRNPFFLINNGKTLPPMFNETLNWNAHNLSEVEDVENSCSDLTEDVIFDLMWQRSMVILVLLLCFDCSVNIVHDFLLIYGWYGRGSPLGLATPEKAETRAFIAGLLSWWTWGLATASAMMWSMGLAETFVAPHTGHACFFQLSTLEMLASVVAVFSMFVSFYTRTSKLWRAACFGEHLYAYHHEVPFRLVCANLDAGLLPNVESSLQRATLVADVVGDMHVVAPELYRRETSEPIRYYSLQTIYTNFREFISGFAKGKAMIYLLVWFFVGISLEGNRKLPLVGASCIVLYVVLALARKLMSQSHEKELEAYKRNRKSLASTQSGITDLRRTQSDCRPNQESRRKTHFTAIARRIGNQINFKVPWFNRTGGFHRQDRHLIDLTMSFAITGFILSGVPIILARTGFLMLKFCPWLGSHDPDPSSALALGFDLSIILVYSAYTYHEYIFLSFRQELLLTVHRVEQILSGSEAHGKDVQQMLNAVDVICRMPRTVGNDSCQEPNSGKPQ